MEFTRQPTVEGDAPEERVGRVRARAMGNQRMEARAEQLNASGGILDLGGGGTNPYKVSWCRKSSASCEGSTSVEEVSSRFDSCTKVEHSAGKGGEKGTSRRLLQAREV